MTFLECDFCTEWGNFRQDNLSAYDDMTSSKRIIAMNYCNLNCDVQTKSMFLMFLVFNKMFWWF